MANRYWVGGTGTWDSTSTTYWSTSSGGAGGASVPTAADNVYFDANSNVGTDAFTVTMATTPRVCNDFTASGLDGTMTLAGTSVGLTISGSLTFQATNFTCTYTGTTTFNATTTGKTVTTNGVAFGAAVTFDGVGGGWTLGSAFSCGSSTLTITNGTFDTSSSGNYAVTASGFVSSNSNIRTINLNASTLTLSSSSTPWQMTDSTNATLNAGTSTINLSNGLGPNFSGGGLTYYTVAWTSVSSTSGTRSIEGANTFTNLTVATVSSAGVNEFSFYASQIISGTLTVTGSSGNRRQFLNAGGSPLGTAVTLTCASIAAMTDVDFRDITIAGAHGTLSGTRLGDCGGNSNITFVAGKTVYWNLAAGGNWNANAWAASSGGAVATTNYPLPQDTAIIENTGLNTSASITINIHANIGTFEASTRTNAMTFNISAYNPYVYGDFLLGSSSITITALSTGILYFGNRSIKTVNSAGSTFGVEVHVDSPGGGIQLVTNNLTVSSTQDFFLRQGTLDLNNLTLTTPVFDSDFSTTRSIAFGTTGSIVLNSTVAGTAGLEMSDATGFTFTGNSNISAAMSVTRTFRFTTGATASNRLNLNLTSGASLPTLTGTYRQINFTGSTIAPPSSISCQGFTLASGGTYTSTTFTIVGSGTLTYNAKTVGSINVFGSGITTTLADAGINGTTTLTNGTLDLAGFTLTCTTRLTTATGTKNITFNGGTLDISGANTTAFNNAAPTGFTTTAGTGTGTISMTAATAKTFVGGGSTFNCTLDQGGAGALTITGSNTFSNITNTRKSTSAASILFTAGTTNTFADWNASGESTRLLTIGSVTAASHTLSKSSGTVSTNYLSISRSIATGGATWQSLTTNGNVDGGNNTGWIFTLSAGNFLNILMF
jgi:hypothetical protein